MRLAFVLCCLLALHTASAQWWPQCWDGRRAIVHLFEWRWGDIADECERYLQYNGYCGVQVSAPAEHLIVDNEWEQRPWGERYNPLSYKLYTRSGDEKAFADMVKRCNDVGVRIFVDAVLNHMSHWGSGSGVGIGGTKYDANTKDFPGVPYTSEHFNSKTSSPSVCTSASGDVEDWNDPVQARNCNLLGLLDLNQGHPHVQDMMVEYLNRLVSYGVAGFRMDAAKHMWPADLKKIFDRLDDLPTKWFLKNEKPFVVQEVYGSDTMPSSDYFGIGRVTEFNYGNALSSSFKVCLIDCNC